jgi:hypothetical protein
MRKRPLMPLHLSNRTKPRQPEGAKMKGFTKWFGWRRGLTLNEGARPINLTVFWGGPFAPFIYLYLFGRRFHT